MDNVLFKETQNNSIMVIGPIVTLIIFVPIAVIQVGFRKPIGNHPASDGLMIGVVIFSILLAFIFNRMRLTTVITDAEIQVNHGVIGSTETIKLADVKGFSVRKYDAMKEFWGWGVRYNSRGTCYTSHGDNSLEIELISGSRILIGTQRPKELLAIVEKIALHL